MKLVHALVSAGHPSLLDSSCLWRSTKPPCLSVDPILKTHVRGGSPRPPLKAFWGEAFRRLLGVEPGGPLKRRRVYPLCPCA